MACAMRAELKAQSWSTLVLQANLWARVLHYHKHGSGSERFRGAGHKRERAAPVFRPPFSAWRAICPTEMHSREGPARRTPVLRHPLGYLLLNRTLRARTVTPA